MRRLVLAAIGTAMAIGCSADASRRSTAAAPAPAVAPVPVSMRDHFRQARSAQQAIIVGDLPAVRANAAAISLWSLPGHLESWGPFVERMRGAAEVLGTTHSIPYAARALADIVVECGQCHKSLGSNVTFKTSAPPLAPAGTADRMKHHLWATNRLWEGLVGPSDELWQAGAKALLETPLQSTALAHADERFITALVGRVHGLGKRASEATNIIERTRLYGALLATCSVCHRLRRP